MRCANIKRKTKETCVEIEVDLDGTGIGNIDTGVHFLDHMLEQLAKHSLVDMNVTAKGDVEIDDHHTVEDVGLTLGTAIAQALGEKRGIRRYGSCQLPMDDAWVDVALDISGRSYLVWNVDLPAGKIGSFDTELVREFFQALATQGEITLHIERRHGANRHHIVEATFKSVAIALRNAVAVDSRRQDEIPSTKGKL